MKPSLRVGRVAGIEVDLLHWSVGTIVLDRGRLHARAIDLAVLRTTPRAVTPVVVPS
jgi:hypothetical protein